MSANRYIACDLGAESGRVMLGTLEGGHLRLEEVHRFLNQPVRHGESLCWNLSALQAGIREGLEKVARQGQPVRSISTDSWGVDYILYDADGRPMEPIYHYRDQRTERGVKRVFEKLPWEELFRLTGIQFLPFNTVFQLAAEAPERLEKAQRFLGIGDAFNHWLGGRPCYEESLASTTQLYDPRTRSWSEAVIQRLGLPKSIFPEIVPSGTVTGTLQSDLARLFPGEPPAVVGSCSHDTGAAVAAVPAEGSDWAYLSSGTWSLMGVELREPLINDAVRESNFTNEVGFGHTIRFLKNIIGLWLVQECRRHWAQQGQEYDYGTLTELAAQAPAFKALIDPSDERFLPPGDMPGRIAQMCQETGQPVPESPGEFIRCILESLALFYRHTLRGMEQLLGRKIQRLHIVGGGSKNRLLNQFTANALQIPVYTGPTEATATGNVLVQAIAMGELRSIEEARQVVRASFEITVVEPTDTQVWEEAAGRFEELLTRSRNARS